MRHNEESGHTGETKHLFRPVRHEGDLCLAFGFAYGYDNDYDRLCQYHPCYFCQLVSHKIIRGKKTSARGLLCGYIA